MGKYPTKLKKETVNKLVMLLQAGNFVTTSAAAVGIHVNTLKTWIRLGRDEVDEDGTVIKPGRKAYRDVAAAFDEAMGIGEVALLDQVQKGGWKGAAWILERRHPDRWRVKNQFEVAGPGGKPLAAGSPMVFVNFGNADASSPFRFEDAEDHGDPAT